MTQWPKTELEMRTLQLGDTLCKQLIADCEMGEECHIRKHRVYTLPLSSGGRSALRIDLSDKANPKETPFGEQPAVVVPTCLRQMILKYFHEGLKHPGVDRMIRSTRTKYFWPGLDKDCEHYVANCRLCKLRKCSTGQGHLPLQRYNIGIRPFQRCHIDLVGPLQKTVRGYEYILVAKCAFTQWIEVVPLCGKSTLEVTQAIVDKLLSVHGAIEHFITDNGKEFASNIAAAVHHLITNVHTTTTAYNPQSNGKVENQNKTLKDMLAMYVHDNQRDWDVFLPAIVHAYRTTVNAATGYSPFKAVFGREARQPEETWIEEFAESNKVDINEYVNGLAHALLYTWRTIGERIQAHQQADYR